MKHFAAALLSIILYATSVPVAAGELVYVSGRVLDLDYFSCSPINSSIFLSRICYDETNSYLLIELKETWYQYCGVDPKIAAAFLSARSAGSYYNSNIRAGRFDCKGKGLPEYP